MRDAVCELCGGLKVARRTFVIRSWCLPSAGCGGAEHWVCGACRNEYRLNLPYAESPRVPKHRSWFRECPGPIGDALRVADVLRRDE